MFQHIRGRGGIAVGVGAISLLGLASCGGLDDEAPARSAATGAVTTSQQYSASEILVRFRTGTASTTTAAIHAQHAAQLLHEYQTPANLQLVAVPQGKTVEQALEDYRTDPEVLYAEPNLVYDLDVTPNDPSFGSLWGLNNIGQTGGTAGADINGPEAWSLTTGSSAVVIGVLDSGVDYNHPDLAANIFTNPGEIAGNGVDDDGNGWIDDVHGIDTIADTGNPMDTNGHGTHVSGTIAARGDNGIGVVGVNWSAKIVPCKAFSSGGTIANILQCMDYFLALKTRATNRVDIVATNNSWGGGSFSQALYDAIGAHQQAGMLFVAAAGNSYGTNTDQSPHYPSSYDHANIISVLATDHYDQRAYFSNYGPLTVDVGAPGESILSTLPGNSYGQLSGTSMATPHVTGLVGLLKAQEPSRTAAQLKNLILTGGTPTAGTTDACLSGRRIRADAALSCAGQTLARRLAPAATAVTVPLGTEIPLDLLSLTCDAPTPGAKVVTVVETGKAITLVSDGTGRFTGSFAPVTPGTSTLRFPNGDTVKVTAIRTYDPAAAVPYEFPAITGTVLPLNCYSCYTTLPLPFPIAFAGASPGYTALTISNRGVLSFGAQSLYVYDNQPLPSTAAATIVAPFWDDLYTYWGGSVRYAVLGQAPSRQLVIEYRDVPGYYTDEGVTFQVVFFEGSSDIRFNYADVQFGYSYMDNGASATVGVQVASGLAQQFSYNTPSLSDGMSLLWSMRAPFTAAGPDQVVLPGAAVALDGSASRDFDGTIAAYAWTQTAGAPVTLAGADTAKPTFTAPTASGKLTFRLTVTDNEGKTGTDTVDVIVNQAPIAAAGDDLSAWTELPATLDGTGSRDPDGAITGYQWTQLQGATVQLKSASAPVATFIAPAAAGELVFQLTVTDERGFTSTDTVAVDVRLNHKPVAAAGRDRIVRPGAAVTLDGAGSRDPDGSIASYAWAVDACYTAAGACAVGLAGADTATPRFVAPDASALVYLTLTVTDNVGAIATDAIVISAALQAPGAAIVAATSCVQGGSTVALNGTGSSDPDGAIVAYEWTQISGPQVALAGAGAAIASFTAPAEGTLAFELTVTDGDGLSDTAEIAIPIAPLPVAVATASEAVVVRGQVVTLDGSRSAGAAGYAWRQIGGGAVSLSDPSAPAPTFVAPRPSGAYDVLTFELTVTDACGVTATDTVQLTVFRK